MNISAHFFLFLPQIPFLGAKSIKKSCYDTIFRLYYDYLVNSISTLPYYDCGFSGLNIISNVPYTKEENRCKNRIFLIRTKESY